MSLRRQHYLRQEAGTCCFVYACANASIWLGRRVTRPKFLRGCEIARCIGGNCLESEKVVAHFDLPMEKSTNGYAIVERGGIISIMHPIWNGHSLFVEPAGNGPVTAVNSWLGPNVMICGQDELLRFFAPNIGSSWLFT